MSAHRSRRQCRRVRTLRLALALGAVVLVVTVAGAATSTVAAAAPGHSQQNTTNATTAETVTLVTGQTVSLADKTVVSPESAGPHTTETRGPYVLPSAYNSTLYDRELFNVSRVTRLTTQVGGADTLPVVLEYEDRETLLSELPVRIRHNFSVSQTVAATVNLSKQPLTPDLLAAAGVQRVRSDRVVHTTLNATVSEIGATTGTPDANLTGTGVNISIVDSGIDTTHPDLADRILYAEDFTPETEPGIDQRGHGTHVAGIAAGTGSVATTYTGVAPNATLFNMRALGDDGAGAASDVAAAIEESIEREADIISLSLGSNRRSPLIGDAISAAVSNGIVVVASAGNGGSATGTITHPGTLPRVITVGADDTLSRGFADDIAEFSARGPTAGAVIKPELTAPGVRVTAPRSAQSGDPTAGPQDQYTTKSGTSMAAPHVSGVVAMLLEDDPSLTPAQVKARLMSTATPLTGSVLATGAGQVNATAAVSTPIAVDTPALEFRFGADLRQQRRLINITNLADRSVSLTATASINDTAGSPGKAIQLNTTALSLAAGETQTVAVTVRPGGITGTLAEGAVSVSRAQTSQPGTESRTVGRTIIAATTPTNVTTWSELDDIREEPAGTYVLANELNATTPGYDDVVLANASKFTEQVSRNLTPDDQISLTRAPLQSVTARDAAGNAVGVSIVDPTAGTVRVQTAVPEEDGPLTVAYTTAEAQFVGFDPLGERPTEFVGSFAGNGNTISGLVIDRPTEAAVGLFGANNGEVTGLTLSDANITGGRQVGGLVGTNTGGVSNGTVTGQITGTRAVGGLVGANSGVVSNAQANVTVTGNTDVGGLVGANGNATVSETRASGSVTGESRVGGLVGDNQGTVATSFAVGTVSGPGSSPGVGGGLVGRLGTGGLDPGEAAIVRDSYFDTQTTGQAAAAGAVKPGAGTAETRGEVLGLKTRQMQGASARSRMAAFDFQTTWQTVTAPDEYPVLRALASGDPTDDPVRLTVSEIPTTVQPGRPFQAAYALQNTGDALAAFTLELSVNRTAVRITDISGALRSTAVEPSTATASTDTVEPGATTTVTAEYRVAANTTGTARLTATAREPVADVITTTAAAVDLRSAPVPTDPRERALQIADKESLEALSQDDITVAITQFTRGQQRNGITITQDDITTLITLFGRN